MYAGDSSIRWNDVRGTCASSPITTSGMTCVGRAGDSGLRWHDKRCALGGNFRSFALLTFDTEQIYSPLHFFVGLVVVALFQSKGAST